jgi:hypothetical protein
LQNLRYQSHELEKTRRQTRNSIKAEEHTHLALQRKRAVLEHTQTKLTDRLRSFTGQLTSVIKRGERDERTITVNAARLENEQDKTLAMEIVLKKTVHVNDGLQKMLKQHQLARAQEHNKLRSLKQISFRKRKEIVSRTKHLYRLSRQERRLTDDINRTCREIMGMNTVLHESNNAERV